MLAVIPMVCCVTHGQPKISRYKEQVKRAPFSLTHDTFPLQDWDY
jgi:hypothetical protein